MDAKQDYSIVSTDLRLGDRKIERTVEVHKVPVLCLGINSPTEEVLRMLKFQGKFC